MKLNRLQRHTAYILILAELKIRITTGKKTCLCWIMDEISSVFLSALTNDAKDVFPEYWAKRNKSFFDSDGAYYFETDKERIKALTQCIAETY